MTKKLVHLSALCLLISVLNMQAQENENNPEQLDEIVVIATKFETKKEHVGKIIRKISSEEIKNSTGKTVLEVLDNLASIQINGANSAEGKNKSTYIRGGRDRQILVLIDGVPVTDPSGITTTFDLRLLTLSQIESIEIMNGAASTLYGSGAATGVINITLKKAVDVPISMNYEVSLGTNNSQNSKEFDLSALNQNVAFSGAVKKFNYLTSFNKTSVNGLSEAVSENNLTKFKNDPFSATNLYLKLGYDFSENLKVQLYTNYDKNVYDFDAGAFSDSDINNGINNQNRIGFTSNYTYKKGTLNFLASYHKINRKFDSFNGWANSTDSFNYTGKTYVIDAVNNYKVSEKIQIITGVNYQKQSNLTNTPYGEINDDLANYTTLDPYFTTVYNSNNGLNLNAGARLNMHSEYGNYWVYNVNPSYNISNKFKIIASYSTAYITPSIYQLFSQYGNVNLIPEEDKSIETGFVYSINKNVELNSVIFYREEDNAIILPDFITYQNTNKKVFVRGVESDVKLTIFKELKLRLAYSYVYKSEDLDYIPKNKFTALFETSSIKNTYISVQFKNISKRTYFDVWGTGSIINLDAYNLADFYANYTIIKDRLSVFAQVANIFDENYVETIGYTTKGRNFKLGLAFQF